MEIDINKDKMDADGVDNEEDDIMDIMNTTKWNEVMDELQWKEIIDQIQWDDTDQVQWDRVIDQIQLDDDNGARGSGGEETPCQALEGTHHHEPSQQPMTMVNTGGGGGGDEDDEKRSPVLSRVDIRIGKMKLRISTGPIKKSKKKKNGNELEKEEDQPSTSTAANKSSAASFTIGDDEEVNNETPLRVYVSAQHLPEVDFLYVPKIRVRPAMRPMNEPSTTKKSSGEKEEELQKVNLNLEEDMLVGNGHDVDVEEKPRAISPLLSHLLSVKEEEKKKTTSGPLLSSGGARVPRLPIPCKVPKLEWLITPPLEPTTSSQGQGCSSNQSQEIFKNKVFESGQDGSLPPSPTQAPRKFLGAIDLKKIEHERSKAKASTLKVEARTGSGKKESRPRNVNLVEDMVASLNLATTNSPASTTSPSTSSPVSALTKSTNLSKSTPNRKKRRRFKKYHCTVVGCPSRFHVETKWIKHIKRHYLKTPNLLMPKKDNTWPSMADLEMDQELD